MIDNSYLKGMFTQVTNQCPFKFDDNFEYYMTHSFDLDKENYSIVNAKSKRNGAIYSFMCNGCAFLLKTTIINIENIPKLDDTEIAQFIYDFSKNGIFYRTNQSTEGRHLHNSIFSLMSDIATKFEVEPLQKGWALEIEDNPKLFLKECKNAFDLMYRFNQTLYEKTQLDDISLYTPPCSWG